MLYLGWTTLRQVRKSSIYGFIYLHTNVKTDTFYDFIYVTWKL